MFRKRRNRRGPDAGKRFCIECGLKPREDGPARYGPGALFSVRGDLYVICLACKQLKEGLPALVVRRNAMCESCWLEQRQRQKERQRQREASENHTMRYAASDLDR
ncbi:hypothetical protein PHISCL_03653 [Aspergillus sclerotialis]|uniref:Uncharacterized protein n=1 Tax=Aspergillus sclerotialis TaxID=2070753 RepID=A0A3A2ZLB6_9EURO|nr:hypothetical protein PHISCL_03653 [Aspergillus sclerotialis]